MCRNSFAVCTANDIYEACTCKMNDIREACKRKRRNKGFIGYQRVSIISSVNPDSRWKHTLRNSLLLCDRELDSRFGNPPDAILGTYVRMTRARHLIKFEIQFLLSPDLEYLIGKSRFGRTWLPEPLTSPSVLHLTHNFVPPSTSLISWRERERAVSIL